MRILVITDLYPVKDEEKLTPRTIYDFVQEWQKMGHEVSVIKPNFILNSFIRKKPFYKTGIYGIVYNINYWLPFIGNINNKIKIDIENFDIIIAHMPSGLIFANNLNKYIENPIPIVAGVHVSDLEVLTKSIYSIYFKKELKKAYKNAIKISARSDVLKNKFLKIFPEYKNKIFTAFSGIDENIITKRTWNPHNKLKVLTCANLKKRKNIDKVIIACKNLNNVNLTVIGNGSELHKLKKIKSDNVVFSGYLPQKEVLKKMRDSDIFILPSENETFGMVFLEAMASGCVTIGLKNDGIDGIIENGKNGYLCELDNIKNTLQYIANSDLNNEILGNSYNTILKYTKENAAKNYIDNIINEL